MILLILSLTVVTAAHSMSSNPVLPPWKPTYNMPQSTIMMPCNVRRYLRRRFAENASLQKHTHTQYSGMFDPVEASKWGIVDFDWSNAKQLWANTKPMDCQERLVSQVEQVKRVNNQTRTFVYRNLVKALPWYTSVREKLEDSAYSGFLALQSGGKRSRRALALEVASLF